MTPARFRLVARLLLVVLLLTLAVAAFYLLALRPRTLPFPWEVGFSFVPLWL